jgi:hypothetical protein
MHYALWTRAFLEPEVECDSLSRCVWVSSWQGMDLSCLILIVNFTELSILLKYTFLCGGEGISREG